MIRTTLKIALAQLNPIVGDVDGNEAKARDARIEAARLGADLVMFPELFLAGYPGEDLARDPAFRDSCRAACRRLARETSDGGPAVLVGLPWADGDHLRNACAVLDAGRIAAIRFKVNLADDGDFAEKRVFVPGPLPGPVNLRGVRFGLPIGSDIRSEDVVECLAETGAEILLVPGGSPYRRGGSDRRFSHAVLRVTESGLPLVHLNQVGGQDERVFDGASFVLNAGSSLAGQLPAFREAIVLTEWERRAGRWTCLAAPRALVEEGDEADYAACVLGLRDHVTKNRCRGIVLNLADGVGSALCAAMAVDALGPGQVRAVTLPSRHAPERSLADASSCARALGIRHDVLPVAAAMDGFASLLAPLIAEEAGSRLQEDIARGSRGIILAALADALGAMAVATVDKSGMAVGQPADRGGMQGGFAPLKDLYRTEVRRLAALRNRWRPAGALGPDGPVIPRTVLDGPSSGEGLADRAGGDALPPGEELDGILRALLEDGSRLAEI
ncbi:MAG: nitrilase-related carbon-nitrogen hydrolase, partial [Microvirga sp.]